MKVHIRIQGKGSWLAEIMANDDLRIIGLTGDEFLPVIPGPPPLFHNRPKPDPTLKEVFQNPAPPQ